MKILKYLVEDYSKELIKYGIFRKIRKYLKACNTVAIQNNSDNYKANNYQVISSIAEILIKIADYDTRTILKFTTIFNHLNNVAQVIKDVWAKQSITYCFLIYLRKTNELKFALLRVPIFEYCMTVIIEAKETSDIQAKLAFTAAECLYDFLSYDKNFYKQSLGLSKLYYFFDIDKKILKLQNFNTKEVKDIAEKILNEYPANNSEQN